MKKKLTVPAALAVVALSGCGDSSTPVDASTEEAGKDSAVADAGGDSAVADAGGDAATDAGCEPFQEYDPDAGMCVPVA